MKRKTRNAIETARVLENELTDLGRDANELEPHEVQELSLASGDLQAAWEDLFPERSDLAEILDQQRAEQWWHRKLIATFPIAVLETDVSGRVLWANTAWASLLSLPVLQIVRTDIRRYVDTSDHQVLDEFLAQFASLGADAGAQHTTLRINSTPSVLANIEVTVEERPQSDDTRLIVTWVVEPISEIQPAATEQTKIAHVFSRLGLLPLRSRTNQELLNEAVVLSTHIAPEQSSVSVVVGDPAEAVAISTSNQEAQTVDAAQLLTDEGPSREVWQSGESALASGPEIEHQWQRFWNEVQQLNIGSILVVPIRVGDEVFGILNVYAEDVHAFDRESTQQIELFAEAVGAVLHHVDEEKQLRTLASQLEKAMRSREVIAQAKGILMAKYGCTAETALEKLKKVSQEKNIRVRVLAQEIVASVTRRAEQSTNSES